MRGSSPLRNAAMLAQVARALLPVLFCVFLCHSERSEA